MPDSTTENQKVVNNETAYADSWEHISDELKRLDLLIHLRLLKQRNLQTTNPLDQFKGLVLSEEEILRLLKNENDGLDGNTFSSLDSPEIQKLKEALNQLESQIQEKKAASLKNGTYLSFPQLSRIFNLTPFEEQCLLICLAPKLDIKYEKLYAYLQDDITRKKPGVNMVLNLLCNTLEGKLSARNMFDQRAPLLKYRLIYFIDTSIESPSSLFSRFLKLDDRIINFLLEHEAMDIQIEPLAKLVPPHSVDNEDITDDIRVRLSNFIHAHFSDSAMEKKNMVVYLHGPYGSGKRFLAVGVCNSLQIPLILVDSERIFHERDLVDDIARILGRESLLQQAVLCFENFDCLLEKTGEHVQQIKPLLEIAKACSPLMFMTAKKQWRPEERMNDCIFIDLKFSVPDEGTRKRIWEDSLKEIGISGNIDPGALASKFKFAAGQIRDAVIEAQDQASWRSPGDGNITLEDLYAACREQNDSRLISFARKINPKYVWDDIILPPTQKNQLRELCNRVKYRHTVYCDWGFSKKLSLGKGLAVLFSGPSGTGKTMAAEIIANELRLDLYKIDLSQVVSKYVGETEKNLNGIFHEAETSNAILLFDEADALFGRRTEIRDAHDRYANIEVNYLLQKLEEYEGIIIMASNLSKNIDDAFQPSG